MRSIMLALVAFVLLALPAAAQGLFTNSPLSCVRLPGLITVLKRTVNEPQIIPITGQRLSTDVLQGQGDCTYVYNRQVVRQDFIGWLMVGQWLVPLERVCYATSDPPWPDCHNWRPADLLRRSQWTLPRKCIERLSETRGGITIYGRNVDWRFQEWRCAVPIRKF